MRMVRLFTCILALSLAGWGCKKNMGTNPNSAHPLAFVLYGHTTAFESPAGICVDSANNLYVADYGNNRILKYDSNGNWLMTIGGSGVTWAAPAGQPTHFLGPLAVSVDGAGNIYVLEGDQATEILVFSAAGVFTTSWGPGLLNQPSQLTVIGGVVYVADAANNRIATFSTAGAPGLTAGSGPGTLLGQLDGPSGVAVDGAGNIYVSDRGNHRIEVFNSAGAAVSIWGANQVLPKGMAFDPSGHLWVVNDSSVQLSEFNSNGSLIQTWSPEDFPNAMDAAFDSTGAVWVSFTGNAVEYDHVSKFTH